MARIVILLLKCAKEIIIITKIANPNTKSDEKQNTNHCKIKSSMRASYLTEFRDHRVD